MKIHLEVSENFNFDFFNEYLISMRLCSDIQVFSKEYFTSSCQDSISFKIEKIEKIIYLTCTPFKIFKDFPEDIHLNSLCNFVVECCGFKKTILSGLSVRDSNGKKFKPEIEIYSFQTLSFTSPNTLNFIKEKDNVIKRDCVNETEIFFNNEILSSILSDSPIFFKSEDKIYKIFNSLGRCFLEYQEVVTSFSIDYLIDFSVKNDLLNHFEIQKNFSFFRHFLDSRIENLVFNKKFYKVLLNDKKAKENLIDFLENVPKFQDERDLSVMELKTFIFENYSEELIMKYSYLNVFKYKQIINKNKFSLGKFE